MPKYYVDSGKLSFVCDADDPTEAVFVALSSSDEMLLGPIIRVNEQGHGDDLHDSDIFLPTVATLTELGDDCEPYEM